MSEGEVSIKTATPMPIAAVRRRVTRENLTHVTISVPTWALVQERRLKSLDQTVVIYHDSPDLMLIDGPRGVEADVGISLAEPFDSDRLLQCVMTPGGLVAHARHYGHYELLPVIHTDIRAWCVGHGLAIAGLNWEHYTLWHEDSLKRITDVYYLLA